MQDTRNVVLIVEDEPIVRMSISDALLQAGFEALEFRGGEGSQISGQKLLPPRTRGQGCPYLRFATRVSDAQSRGRLDRFPGRPRLLSALHTQPMGSHCALERVQCYNNMWRAL